ncbi:MAG TPA: methyltransferase domain-containing protein [Ktedonobacterales bacterium]|nr:methyltransferase domain-containing protein [Ktedonobacterales bacterium]
MAWFRWWRRSPKDGAVGGQAQTLERKEQRFHFLGDRRHVANAPYVLPKDDREVQRLDFQHYMLRYLLRGNYAAPVTNPTDILDVGCGTARWAIEMATIFPQANVVGVDLVPPPMEEAGASDGASARPDNFAFVQGNILEGLPFADGTFNFTHMRLLVFALPRDRWQDVANELVRVTRPGGWVEWLEGGIATMNPGPACERLNQFANEAAARRGIDPSYVFHIGEFLRQAGLVNVQARDVILPTGARAGRIGQMSVTDYLAVISGMKGPLVAMGVTTPQEFEQLMAQARVELDQGQSYWRFPLAYGQRPW